MTSDPTQAIARLRALHEGIVDVAEDPIADTGAYLVQCTMQLMRDLPALLDCASILHDLIPTMVMRRVDTVRAEAALDRLAKAGEVTP